MDARRSAAAPMAASAPFRPRSASYAGSTMLTRATSAPAGQIVPSGMMMTAPQPTSPRSPRLGPRGAASVQAARLGRHRSLSETGRQLFAGLYRAGPEAAASLSPLSPLSAPALMPHELPAAAASMSWERPVSTSATAAAASKSRRRRGKENASNKKPPSAASNPYSVLMAGSDDEGVDGETFQRLVRSNSTSHVEPTELKMRSAGRAPAQGVIQESVVGEDDDDAEALGWETVPKRGRQKKKGPSRAPVQPRRASPLPSPRPNSYSSGEEDDLYDLQWNHFAGRQVGRSKKPMQFKAAEKRGYAIDKRARQRAGH